METLDPAPLVLAAAMALALFALRRLARCSELVSAAVEQSGATYCIGRPGDKLPDGCRQLARNRADRRRGLDNLFAERPWRIVMHDDISFQIFRAR